MIQITFGNVIRITFLKSDSNHVSEQRMKSRSKENLNLEPRKVIQSFFGTGTQNSLGREVNRNGDMNHVTER